ncbi:unnamed protein product [Strongylus vulgaris]|uniref:Uncharacterized protein n=1 Tax=Strongylus vulgaris TaxID=40348 RepID=A0A3P7IFM4_STRVU|nr:unnamed protein product [Strongylus vulgaris]
MSAAGINAGAQAVDWTRSTAIWMFGASNGKWFPINNKNHQVREKEFCADYLKLQQTTFLTLG